MLNSPLLVAPPFRRRPALSATAVGGTTQVAAASWLRTPVWYHWWLDGVYLGRTSDGDRTFRLDADAQARLEVFDTRDPLYDPTSFLCHAAASRRTIAWLRSLDAGTASYRIEQQIGVGSWTGVARVAAELGTWVYAWTTPRLADLTQYAWRVVPLDAADRAGTPLAISAEIVVRAPDAPAWSFTFSAITQRITIASP